ncbi:sialidase family protein [Aspergillus lucknowensis]|uniref:Sialidase n=1 Tax=Aspergillus lucknowensis TaxID=176173 RepID=A0ABR4LHS0_9EURO
MRFLSLLSVLPLALAAGVPRATAPTTFSDVTIFSPPSDYVIPRTLYARTVQLPNGDLLATWENYSPEPPMVYFPIYRSIDNGKTWESFSRVEDTVNEVGLRYQPFLYYLDEAIGSFEAGTLLLAGNSIPKDLSTTQLDLYASTDSGATWEFVSHIASGGEALPNNGLTPVWEPFLLAHNGKLICYYSDQRDNATYGQKLVHQTSSDLKTWGGVVDDVTYPTYTDRPGMPVITKLPSGDFLMTYEHGGDFGTSSYSFPVYYKISSDPENFKAAADHQLIVSNGAKPDGSPYVVWSSYGGANGTIIVSCGGSGSIFINQALGTGEWTEITTPEPTSYSRSLRILQQDAKYLLLNGGGVLSGSSNEVTVTVLNLEDVIA